MEQKETISFQNVVERTQCEFIFCLLLVMIWLIWALNWLICPHKTTVFQLTCWSAIWELQQRSFWRLLIILYLANTAKVSALLPSNDCSGCLFTCPGRPIYLTRASCEQVNYDSWLSGAKDGVVWCCYSTANDVRDEAEVCSSVNKASHISISNTFRPTFSYKTLNKSFSCLKI